jgi:hypothetical protein
MKAHLKSLLTILSTKRPAFGNGEAWVAKTFLKDAAPFMDPKTGDALAYVVVTDPNSRVMFSSHLDSVDHEDGKKEIIYDKNLELVYLKDGQRCCLGADDGAGVWLMLEMIKAGVKGTFLFHTGEEVGGVGSSGMAKHYRDFLKGFDKAIAFDRKGREDVITHQGGVRSASDAFALALASSLGMEHKPSDGGTFTDTSNYKQIIAECTNVAIGYNDCHGPEETLEVDYLLELRQACIKVDWEALPVDRDPSKVENMWDSRFLSYRNRYDLEFTLVETRRGDFEIWLDGDLITTGRSREWCEGYCSCYADFENAEAIIIDESESERNLKARGYDLEELEMDNPFSYMSF